MTYACNSTQETKAEDCELKNRLGYTARLTNKKNISLECSSHLYQGLGAYRDSLFHFLQFLGSSEVGEAAKADELLSVLRGLVVSNVDAMGSPDVAGCWSRAPLHLSLCRARGLSQQREGEGPAALPPLPPLRATTYSARESTAD